MLPLAGAEGTVCTACSAGLSEDAGEVCLGRHLGRPSASSGSGVSPLTRCLGRHLPSCQRSIVAGISKGRPCTQASRPTRVDPRTSHAWWPCHCIIVRSASRRHDATVPNVAAQGTERILGMRPAQALVLMRTVAFLESRGCNFYRPHPCAKHESKSLKFFMAGMHR